MQRGLQGTSAMAAVASASCCSDSTSSCRRSTGGEGSSRHCSMVCHIPGRLPTPSLHLSHLVYTNMALSSGEKIIFLLCFQTGFGGPNSPDPVCECYCIGIPNICRHLNGGRKSELVPSCYYNWKFSKGKRQLGQ